jgi:hypothetical protein
VSIKQKILMESRSSDIRDALNVAIQMGWLVQSVTVNSDTNCWIAVLYREAS